MITKTFGATDDPAVQAERDAYVVYMKYVNHCIASMELVLFPDGPAWSYEARRIKAFRERAAQQ
jgi:hypothetical protein